MSNQPFAIPTDAPLQAMLDRPDSPALLRQALADALSWQTRNETTVARALASPGLAPLWTAALLALGATVVLGDREASLADWQKHRGDKPTELRVLAGGIRWGEAHVGRTPADEPIVAAVAVVELDGRAVRQARVALVGAWRETARLAEAPAALVGGPLDEERIRAVAEAVEKEVAPRGDFRGSAAYRRAMAGVLTRRALEQCSLQIGLSSTAKDAKSAKET